MSESGTGEAIHFLQRLTRANETQRELALDLYWDPERVRIALALATLPEGEGRLALSINEGDRGPFVVVTREGRFVTCLAEGMKHDLPLIGYARLTALLAKADRHRERVKLAQELCGDERLDKVFGILRRRGEATCREEFLAACALQPVLRHEILSEVLHQYVLVDDLYRYLENRKAIKRRDEPRLRQYWQRLWYLGVLLPLAAVGGPQGIARFLDQIGVHEKALSLTWLLLRHDDKNLTLRALFSLAKIGKPLLAGAKHRFRTAGSVLLYCDAFLSLVTLAVRLPKHRKEIVKTLLNYKEIDPLLAPFLKNIPTRVFEIASQVIDAPEEMYEICGEAVRKISFKMLEGLDRPTALRFERPEDIPLDDAYALVANSSEPLFANPENIGGALMFIPWLVRIEGPELFAPRELMLAFNCEYSRQRALEMLGRRDKVYDNAYGEFDAGVKARQGPSKNGPCPCGSGKKYKRCCLGQGAPAGEPATSPPQPPSEGSE